MAQILQSLYATIADLGWFAIALMAAVLFFGAKAAWGLIDVHLDAAVNRNYNDVTGAHSKNLEAHAHRIEKSIQNVLEEHRAQQTPAKKGRKS